MKERIGEPTPLASLLGQAEKTCERITGKTLDEWATVFAERRRAGYRAGHFRGGTMLQMDPGEGAGAGDYKARETEIDAYVRRYGLDEPDDFVIAKNVPVDVVARNRKAAGLPFPRIPQDGRNKPPAETLVVYMVNPDKYPR